MATLSGGAASFAYGAVLEEIGAVRLNGFADFRAQLRTLRRGRQRRR